MAFEIGTKNCIECESGNSPKNELLLSKTPLTPMHFQRGANQSEGNAWLCSATWNTAIQQQHTYGIRATMCVFWSLKREKIEVKLNFFTGLHMFSNPLPPRLGFTETQDAGLDNWAALPWHVRPLSSVASEVSAYNAVWSKGLHIDVQPFCCIKWKTSGPK